MCVLFCGVFGICCWVLFLWVVCLAVRWVLWALCYVSCGPHTTAPHGKDVISIATLCRKRERYRPSYIHCPLIIALLRLLHRRCYQAPLIARYPLFTLPPSFTGSPWCRSDAPFLHIACSQNLVPPAMFCAVLCAVQRSQVCVNA